MINSWDIKWKLVSFLFLINCDGSTCCMVLVSVNWNFYLKPCFAIAINQKRLQTLQLLWTQAAQAHYRNADVTLACKRYCVTNGYLQRLVWDVLKQFFLKVRKNVMFLNKIDLPYCLVVFFVVCPRLRPFWSVFGELALFWCSTATKRPETRANNKEYHKTVR